MSRLLSLLLAAVLAACEERSPGPKTVPQAESPPRRVLESPLAGRWYEGNPERLRTELNAWIEAAPDELLKGVCALILPHAGYRWSGPTAAHGVRQVRGRPVDRVVVIGPSHRYFLENLAHLSTCTHWSTPLGAVPLDIAFMEDLRRYSCFGSLPGVDEEEHSVQIEIPLLQAALGSFRLVPIVVGRLDAATARTMGRILAGRIDARTLVVASSDFTHYGENYDYVPFRENIEANLRKLDMGAFEAIKTGRADTFYEYVAERGTTICGRQAIRVLLEMLAPGAEFRLLQYDTSGRISGDFTNSVSYLSIAVRGSWVKGEAVDTPPAGPLDEKDRRLLLRLARRTLEARLEQGGGPEVEALGLEITEAMRRPRAAFVTLHRDGRLRGCIGGLVATRPLYREVMARVLQAALEDGRFNPVEARELPDLHLEISVLTTPRTVASPQEIVLGRHGIILEKGGHSAVFLPQVAREQGWGLEETLDHLSEKAGLPRGTWREGATFRVFEAEVFGEPVGREVPRPEKGSP